MLCDLSLINNLVIFHLHRDNDNYRIISPTYFTIRKNPVRRNFYKKCVFSILANALKCWRCSSDASSAAFCGDPFEPSIINEQQRRWSFVDCSFPPSQQPFNNQQQYGSSTRPVCKKMKQLSKLHVEF